MTADFADQLNEVEFLVSNNNDCHVIIGGDFNVDFSRNRLHTAMLDSFCDNTGLNPIVRHEKCSIDYSYHFNMTRFGVLDHFLLSGTLFSKSVEQAYVIHDPDNTSDHDPIAIKFMFELQHIGICARVYKPRVSWAKATESDLCNYRSALADRLRSFYLPKDALLCTDLRCNDLAHLKCVNDYSLNITNACIEAAEATIPHTCNRPTSGRIPGWSEHVQPLREKSLFWHRMWIDCDRPKTGAVADSMRRTRAAYNYAIRQIRKDEESIIRERVASALLEDGGRNFWSEIKRIRSKKENVSRSVDGLSEADSIAKLFAAKYRELYTSVPYNEIEMQEIIGGVQAQLANTTFSQDCIFNFNDVKTAVSKLKAHKSEGSSDFTSDHIIHAGDECLLHIAFLFTSMVVHGSAPECFKLSTIVPIPKGRNTNLTDSANFRGIALSSLYGKLLDNIILERFHDKLVSCDMQFGFKAKSSTNLCSFVLKETIAYYIQNQSPVFCTFLDASKAFDKLHYCKLFKLLVKREVPSLFVRLLANIYTQNFVRVSWGGAVSDYFSAVNGVKQGAVLSPVLFCIYVDDLLLLLSKAGVGCFIGPNFVGALAYADDIVLIAPTPTALRRLLAICESYARDYCISFNSLKTKGLVIIPRERRDLFVHVEDLVFFIDDKPISIVKSFSHLGHLINSDLSDDDDIAKRRNDFIGQLNNNLCYFKNLHSHVQYKLFHSYCTSYYGCELWQLSNPNVDSFCVAWRKGLRRIWKLPSNSHCSLLPIISHCLPIFDELCRRFLNFARSCIKHDCPLIRFIACYGIVYARSCSPIGQNVLYCLKRYNCTYNNFLFGSVNSIINLYCTNSIDDSTFSIANLLSELISVRDGLYDIPINLTKEDLMCIIENICTC
jgi:hypothetical protein